MPRYFMGGTRLEGFEKMMMDPSRSDTSPEEARQGSPARKPPARQPDKSSAPERKPREGGV